ncbi:hypothetical protein EZS27_004080 [termite gut metagenome]|uniref:Uncharacterized protein n=1 Tax=termite gut metagenome TaxID=433724 RepID=A0A5J4ST92_9ZZZZ
MEIENSKGILEMGENVSIDIERTNPILSDQGSKSLPFRIERTAKNNFLLGFPSKYERKYQYPLKQDVNVRLGRMNENATMEILSVSDKIESVLYLGESSFYNRIRETKLTTVFEGVERNFYPKSMDRETRIGLIVQMLEQMMFSSPDYSGDFTIFPIAADCEVLPNQLSHSGLSPAAKALRKNVINDIIRYSTGGNLYLRAHSSYTYNDDQGVQITLPPGYGVTIFLRFRYILRKIFDYFGLTLEQNVFDTDSTLKKCCVLNNTMDALMPGYFIESQLVPDCTVNEFLDVVREGINADFYVNVEEKTARLVLFDDILSAEPDMDLTGYLSKEFDGIAFSTPKQVSLTINKNLPLTATSTETLYEFQSKYPEFYMYEPTFPDNKIFPDSFRSSIWKHSLVQGWWKADRLSSMNFNYDTMDGFEREIHTIPCEVPVSILGSVEGGEIYYLTITGSARNLNSFIIVDSQKQTVDNAECPIMLSLELSDIVKPGETVRTGMSNSGRLTSHADSLLLWDDRGLFKRFFTTYDNILRTSFHLITYHVRMPLSLLHSFRFDRLKIINNQPLLPVSLKYKLTNSDSSNSIEVEMAARTIKYYQ